MDSVYRGGRGLDPSAVPGVDPTYEGGVGVTLEVDGELFALQPDEFGGTAYTWLTGRNDGYGFGTSPTPNWSAEAHRESIRSFLAQIDPATGHLEEG